MSPPVAPLQDHHVVRKLYRLEIVTQCANKKELLISSWGEAPSPDASDARAAEFGRTAGEYVARWHWVLKLLAAMPQPGTPLWKERLAKRGATQRSPESNMRLPLPSTIGYTHS